MKLKADYLYKVLDYVGKFTDCYLHDFDVCIYENPDKDEEGYVWIGSLRQVSRDSRIYFGLKNNKLVLDFYYIDYIRGKVIFEDIYFPEEDVIIK